MGPTEFELTPALVAETRDEMQSQFQGQILGRGEMKNLVFETYVARLGLPWKRIDIGDIPDFDDPMVERLHQELGAFEDLF